MKVVYVLPHATLCGGVKVIAEHVSRLVDRGHDAEVWGLTGDFGWFNRPVPHRRFDSTDWLGAQLQCTPAAKVATFWVTASWVAPNLLPGESGYYLIQDEDELTYGGSERGSSYRLGLIPITESHFVTNEIERKHGVRCNNVGIGIEPRVYSPLPFIRESRRILAAARTTSAGPAGLKGWDTIQEVTRLAAERVPGVSLVTYGMEHIDPLPWLPHIHLRHPSDRKLRELYSQSGVFLSCSRHEGFGLPMLEAMACRCPVVCTDAHGNREFCIDGETALVRNDPDSLADALASVLTDPALSLRIGDAGFEISRRYRWPLVIDRLERVLGGNGIPSQ